MHILDIKRHKNDEMGTIKVPVLVCVSVESKAELAREFCDRIQSRNVALGTSDDWYFFKEDA